MTDYNEIDLSVIAELRDILGEELEEMYQEFIDQSSAQMETLHDAALTGRLDLVMSIAHQLASSAGNMGFLPFSHDVRALENGCRSGEITQPMAQIDALAARHQRLITEIVTLRQQG